MSASKAFQAPCGSAATIVDVALRAGLEPWDLDPRQVDVRDAVDSPSSERMTSASSATPVLERERANSPPE